MAPDIGEAILGERTDQALMLEKPERPLPASWEEQRRQLLGYSVGTQVGRSHPVAHIVERGVSRGC